MEIKFTDYECKDKVFSISFEPGKIYGVTGKNINEFLASLTIKKLNKGSIYINDEKITKDSVYEYRKKIAFITALNTKATNVYNIMIEYIKRNNLNIKDPIKKIKDSLKIMELEESILIKNIFELSTSEKKLLSIAINLLSNPEILIIDEPFKCLDKQTEKKLFMLLQRLKEQFKKVIIIASEDANMLYKYTNEMIFIKNNEILLTGKTDECYLKVDFLKKHKLSIPKIVEFTYIAKKKKSVKIDYHKDVRDIIKDIYKHI